MNLDNHDQDNNRRGNNMVGRNPWLADAKFIVPATLNWQSSAPVIASTKANIAVTEVVSHCRSLVKRRTCNTPLVNNGAHGSGYCEECWYPSIRDDHTYYQQLREEGHDREESGLRAGIFNPL
jgi:hypothetical protein